MKGVNVLQELDKYKQNTNRQPLQDFNLIQSYFDSSSHK